jgi:prepilin peptidase CpaA
MPGLIPFVLTVVIIALLAVAALHDMAARTIPDWMPVSLAMGGLALRLQTGGVFASVALALLILLVMAALWFRGFIGGGDVKLTSATALALPPSEVGSFLLTIALAGGVLALLYLGLAVIVRRPAPGIRRGLPARILKAETWRMHRRGPIPYGVAIATGGLFVLIPIISG